MDLHDALVVSPRPTIALAALVSLSLSISGTAIAQVPDALHGSADAQATAAARATFLEGVACADAGDWGCAVERFGRARAMHASPVIAFNHGIALAHVGRVVEASETFHALARDASTPADLRGAARRGVAELAPRIGRLTIELVGPVDGVVVSIDEAPFDTSLLGAAVPSDPGDHVIDARRDGRLVARARVHLAAGESERAELRIPAPESTRVASLSPDAAIDAARSGGDALTTPPPRPRHEVYEEWWVWALVGVVVVGAGVGIGFGVAAASSASSPTGSLGTIDSRP